MSKSAERGWRRAALAGAGVGLALLPLLLAAAPAAPASAPNPAVAIGRAPTPAELRAWDIDVRADFQGLPPGSGSVEQGAKIWEASCASCHGDFGESNSVFTPLVGGTTKADIESGRSAALASRGGYPHRTTLMKVSKLSTLWDYIHRAMPWNAPKSLAPNDVYAVLAYLLNLGDIVPADFTLSERNIAQVQERLPNRNGHVFYEPLWKVGAAGDVKNTACMRDCPVGAGIGSSLPEQARNSNGNIAEQVRPFGPVRGTNTVLPPSDSLSAAVRIASAVTTAPAGRLAATSTSAPLAGAAQAAMPAATAACMVCHGVANKIVGPGFRDVAARYAARADAVDYLSGKIVNGGNGVWGPIPMPPQAQLSALDAHTIARWLVDGAK